MADTRWLTSDSLALAVARAGGCCFPNCAVPAMIEADGARLLLVDVVPIRGAASTDPRYDPDLSDSRRRSPDNAIALCERHRRTVDADAATYPATTLQAWKRAAERTGGPEAGAEAGSSSEAGSSAGAGAGAGSSSGSGSASGRGQAKARFENLRNQVLAGATALDLPLLPVDDQPTAGQSDQGLSQRLRQWREAPEPFLALIVVGPAATAGAATATAAMAVGEAAAAGWLAGWWRSGPRSGVSMLAEQRADTLVVIEQAAERPYATAGFVDELRDRAAMSTDVAPRRRRLLLLAPGASQEDMAILLDGGRWSNAFLATSDQYELSGGEQSPTQTPDAPDQAAEVETGADAEAPDDAGIMPDGGPGGGPELLRAAVAAVTLAPATSLELTEARLAAIGVEADSPDSRRLARWLRRGFPGGGWTAGLGTGPGGDELVAEAVGPDVVRAVIGGEGPDTAATALRRLARLAAQPALAEAIGPAVAAGLDTALRVAPGWAEGELRADADSADALVATVALMAVASSSAVDGLDADLDLGLAGPAALRLARALGKAPGEADRLAAEAEAGLVEGAARAAALRAAGRAIELLRTECEADPRRRALLGVVLERRARLLGPSRRVADEARRDADEAINLLTGLIGAATSHRAHRDLASAATTAALWSRLRHDGGAAGRYGRLVLDARRRAAVFGLDDRLRLLAGYVEVARAPGKGRADQLRRGVREALAMPPFAQYSRGQLEDLWSALRTLASHPDLGSLGLRAINERLAWLRDDVETAFVAAGGVKGDLVSRVFVDERVDSRLPRLAATSAALAVAAPLATGVIETERLVAAVWEAIEDASRAPMAPSHLNGFDDIAADAAGLLARFDAPADRADLQRYMRTLSYVAGWLAEAGRAYSYDQASRRLDEAWAAHIDLGGSANQAKNLLTGPESAGQRARARALQLVDQDRPSGGSSRSGQSGGRPGRRSGQRQGQRQPRPDQAADAASPSQPKSNPRRRGPRRSGRRGAGGDGPNVEPTSPAEVPETPTDISAAQVADPGN